jgi:hypothetical protein
MRLFLPQKARELAYVEDTLKLSEEAVDACPNAHRGRD